MHRHGAIHAWELHLHGGTKHGDDEVAGEPQKIVRMPVAQSQSQHDRTPGYDGGDEHDSSFWHGRMPLLLSHDRSLRINRDTSTHEPSPPVPDHRHAAFRL